MSATLTRVKGVKRSRRDPARMKVLLDQLHKDFERDGRFKGMSKEDILRQMRRTREEVWAELKHAPGPRR